MEIKAYYIPNTKQTLILSFDNIYIKITDYASWIAKDPKQYNYKKATWNISFKQFIPNPEAIDITDKPFFVETVNLNQPFFNRRIISTLLG